MNLRQFYEDWVEYWVLRVVVRKRFLWWCYINTKKRVSFVWWLVTIHFYLNAYMDWMECERDGKEAIFMGHTNSYFLVVKREIFPDIFYYATSSCFLSHITLTIITLHWSLSGICYPSRISSFSNFHQHHTVPHRPPSPTEEYNNILLYSLNIPLLHSHEYFGAYTEQSIQYSKIQYNWYFIQRIAFDKH